MLAAPDSWYLRDLQRAAGATEQVMVCAFSQITARLGNVAGARLAVGDTDLTGADALLVRSMPPGTLEQVVFRMNALARVEQHGTLVLNPPRALEIAIDKYLTLARLADAGLLVPPTVTCQTCETAMAAFEELGGDVVVKPLFGSEGRGITRVSDPRWPCVRSDCWNNWALRSICKRTFRILDMMCECSRSAIKRSPCDAPIRPTGARTSVEEPRRSRW